MHDPTPVTPSSSIYGKCGSSARFRRPTAAERRFFSYLRHSFAEKASALALATTMLAPFGAILGTPRPAQAAAPTITLTNVDYDSSQDVYKAKEDDTDLRVKFLILFDGSTNTHTARVEGIPNTWVHIGGGGSFNSQAGVWTISSSPGGSSINGGPTFSFSDNSDINPVLTIRAQQLDASSNLVNETIREVTVKIDAVADTPDIAAFPTTGFSNQNVTLNVDAAPTDTDGSEVVSLTLTGVPSGVSFVNGALTNAAIGEWTFTDLPPVLAATGEPVDFTATGVATATETHLDDADDDTSDNTATSAPVAVQVTVTDPPPAPEVFFGGDYSNDVFNAKEDDNDIRAFFGANFSSPTHTHIAVIEGLPSNAILVSGGGILENGTWTRTVSGSSVMTNFPRFSLEESPDHSDLNRSLTFRIRQLDAAGNVVGDVPIQKTLKIDAVADTPDIAAPANFAAVAGEITSLPVTAALNDEDGSEELAVELRGLPAGATANLGQETSPGVWRIEGAEIADLAQLALTFPSAGQFPFTVAAVATEANLDDPDDDPADNIAEATTQVTADVTPAPELCPAVLPAGCLPATMAQLTLKDASPDKKDKVIAQWKGATAFADFGDPLTEAGFGLCLYDKAGALRLAAEAPAGGLCPSGRNEKPCWKAKPREGGFIYRDNALTPDGLHTIVLTTAKPGKTNGLVKLTGKGEPLPLPGPQEPDRYLADGAAPATLQIHRLGPGSERQCWTASLGEEKKNSPTDYIAKCGAKNRPPCAP